APGPLGVIAGRHRPAPPVEHSHIVDGHGTAQRLIPAPPGPGAPGGAATGPAGAPPAPPGALPVPPPIRLASAAPPPPEPPAPAGAAVVAGAAAPPVP